ncbi:MAG: DUF4179 domain-containing protein [Bacillota bacterium]|nr:DUF4179 domain-containing protein [Bacillota bacterium]
MKNIEEILNNKKIDIDQIKAPENIEGRLFDALDSVKVIKTKNKINYKIAAAVILLVLLVVYSHDTLAYFGEKIIGYDNIQSGSLDNLNNNGMGQKINKSYKFSDGTIVTLDGVIYDDKNLYTLYSERNEDKEIDSSEFGSNMINIVGCMEYKNSTCTGEITDDKKQMNNVMKFSAPAFYERKLTFSICRNVNGKSETGNISFVLDRSKAIKRSLNKNINKTVTLNGHKINFKTISVSPLGIEVKGTIDSLIDYVLHHNNEQYNVSFDVVADDKVISNIESGSGNSASLKGLGRTFYSDFEGISSFKKLELSNIILNQTKYYNSSAKSFNLNSNTVNKKIDFDGTSFEVEKVFIDGDSTCVQMISGKNAEIIGAGFFINGQEVHSEYKDLEEVDNDKVRVLWRIYGKGEDIKFKIRGINYFSKYDNKIDVK